MLAGESVTSGATLGSMPVAVAIEPAAGEASDSGVSVGALPAEAQPTPKSRTTANVRYTSLRTFILLTILSRAY
jgi:hypothetical protein